MSHARRQFSVEQKLQIIGEADQYGITQTLRKHNLSHSVYQRWKRQFNAGGASLLKPQYYKVDPELRALQEENAKLKKIIGNQAMELEFKTELLKKKRCPRAEAEGLVGIYQQKGVAVTKLLTWSSLPSSSHYYKATGGTKGIRPSTHSVGKDVMAIET